MQLGYPNHPRRDVLQEIDWIAGAGFAFVDLFLEPDQAALESIDPGAIREALRRHRLGVMGHLAWYLPIGSALRQLREAAVRTAGEYMGAFAAIGAPAATVHADWPGGLFTEAEGIAWQAESLRALQDGAMELGMELLYEPVGTVHDTWENTRSVLDAAPGVGLHLDIGHAHLWGRDPAGVIGALGRRIRHVHLHDNDGHGDQHLPPGTGAIDWDAVVKALRSIGYDRTVTLEVYSSDREYVLLAKRKVEQWFPCGDREEQGCESE